MCILICLLIKKTAQFQPLVSFVLKSALNESNEGKQLAVVASIQILDMCSVFLNLYSSANPEIFREKIYSVRY